MNQRFCLLWLAVLFVQCAAEPTPKTVPTSRDIPTQNVAADSVADKGLGPAAVPQPENPASAIRKNSTQGAQPKVSAQKPATAAAPPATPDAAAEAAHREQEHQRLAQAAEAARRDSLKKQAPSGRFGNGGRSGPASGLSIGSELAARPVVARPKMTDEQTQKTGKVVVNICVDAAGNVVSADYTQRGSTTNDPELCARAVAWAKEYRFAPTKQAKQCGEIVFNFRLK